MSDHGVKGILECALQRQRRFPDEVVDPVFGGGEDGEVGVDGVEVAGR